MLNDQSNPFSNPTNPFLRCKGITRGNKKPNRIFPNGLKPKKRLASSTALAKNISKILL